MSKYSKRYRTGDRSFQFGAGKGDADRTTDREAYNRGYDAIDWGRPVEPSSLPAPEVSPLPAPEVSPLPSSLMPIPPVCIFCEGTGEGNDGPCPFCDGTGFDA